MRHGEKFFPIGSYNLNHAIGHAFNNYAPYEKIRPITREALAQIEDECADMERECERRIYEKEEKIDLVTSFNNSVEEKFELVCDLEESIEELKQEQSGERMAQIFCMFLSNMIDEIKYGENNKGIDPDAYLYVGIEIENPTLNDIKE
jgi:hypothetical protein